VPRLTGGASQRGERDGHELGCEWVLGRLAVAPRVAPTLATLHSVAEPHGVLAGSDGKVQLQRRTWLWH
jgi:hypothetical protein